MQTVRLSIIIPAYNVADYLEKCVVSCETQLKNPGELEIVIINDGSTDDTTQVAQRLVGRFANIRYFEQTNKGLSATRNRGIELAEGDYIWFVDGDDTLTDDGVDELLQKAYAEKLDIHAFNLQLLHTDSSVTPYTIAHEQSGKVYQGIDFVTKVAMPHAACIALYRRAFLQEEKLAFCPGIISEDFEFTPRAYATARRCAYTDEVHYNYLQRPGSIMKSADKRLKNKRSSDFLIIADSLYAFMNSRLPKDSEAARWMRNNVNFAVFQSLAYYTGEAYSLSMLRQKAYYPLAFREATGLMNKMKVAVANFSLSLYLLLYKLK